MQVIETKNKRDKVRKVKKLMLSVKNQIGNVHFIKRSDGKKRRISYRLHVSHPQYVKAPGTSNKRYKRDLDIAHDLLTVYDCACLRYDKKGRLNGRGSFKSIPLDLVTRISVNGGIYKII